MSIAGTVGANASSSTVVMGVTGVFLPVQSKYTFTGDQVKRMWLLSRLANPLRPYTP